MTTDRLDSESKRRGRQKADPDLPAGRRTAEFVRTVKKITDSVRAHAAAGGRRSRLADAEKRVTDAWAAYRESWCAAPFERRLSPWHRAQNMARALEELASVRPARCLPNPKILAAAIPPLPEGSGFSRRDL